jgi:hypothetical protein
MGLALELDVYGIHLKTEIIGNQMEYACPY